MASNLQEKTAETAQPSTDLAGPSPAVYVGNLAPDVTESALYDYFRGIGPVVSVRVCLDANTNKSLGYGYVNFQEINDATRAIEELNDSKLSSRNIRVARVERDPSKRKSGVTNVVLKNLPKECDNGEIKDIFSKFGTIASMKIARYETGEAIGHGYVMFMNEESAAAAVEANGLEFHDQPLTIERFKTMSQTMDEIIREFVEIFVCPLRADVTEEELREAFEKYGEIKSMFITPAMDGKCLCGASITFTEHDDAVKAIDEHKTEDSPLALEGKTLYVTRATSRRERDADRERRYRERQAILAKNPNLYIKYLDDHITSEELRKAFERFGETVSCTVQKDPVTKASRGFGFVSFKEQEAAQKAIAEMTGSTLLGPRPLFVTYAMRSDARQFQFREMQRRNRLAGPPGPPPGMFMGGFPQQPPGMRPGMPPQIQLRGMMPGMPMQAHPGMMPPQAVRGQPGMPPAVMMQNPRMMPPQQPGMHPMMQPGMVGPPGGPQARMAALPAQRPQASANPMGVSGPPPPPPPTAAAVTGFDPDAVMQAPPEQRRNMLGDRIYNSLVTRYPETAAKITGMIIDLEVSEIITLVQNPQLLENKANEALQILQQHEGKS